MDDLALAFDTATSGTVAAVRDGDEIRSRAHFPAPGERPGHTAELLTLVERVLAEAGGAMADVRRIGVGVGPGSFTGLRIGVATGRALGLATGAELVPVSSLDALAYGAGAGPDDGRPVLAVIDARRGEVFVSIWAAGRRVHGAVAIKPQALAALAAAHAPGAPAFGDGALRYRDVFEADGIAVAADADGRHRVAGAALVELTAIGTPVARADLAPDYVRRPDVDDR